MEGRTLLRSLFTNCQIAPENTQAQITWGPEFFEQFLYQSATDPKNLLKPSDFPDRIILPSRYHSLLNQIRTLTNADGDERWSMHGRKPRNAGVYLPGTIIRGEPKTVPLSLIKQQFSQAVLNGEVDSLMGDFHSHRPKRKSFWRFYFGTPLQNPAFSLIDLHGLIFPRSCHLRWLTEGQENLLAIKTDYTRFHKNPEFVDYKSFRKHWYLQGGFNYKYPLSTIKPISNEARFWKLNLAVAQCYDLVLYRGRADADLERVA